MISLQQNEDLVASVADVYEELQTRLIEDIARRLASGGTPGRWQMEKMAELTPLLYRARAAARRADAAAAQRISAALREAYHAGAVDAMVDLISQDRSRSIRMASTVTRVYPLIRELRGIVSSQGPAILRSVEDAYRAAVASGAAAELAGIQTRDQTVRRALEDLADRGITTFVDSRGRRWNARSYVEMAMRSSVHNAQRAGHVDQLVAQDHTLVMLSKHAQECSLCRPWEGKVLTLKPALPDPGAENTLREARASGLFHPNCRHRLKAYFPGVTRDPPKEQYGGPTYERLQEQRSLRAKAQQWERRRAAALTPADRAKAAARARMYRDELRAQQQKYPLPRVNQNQEAYDRAKLAAQSTRRNPR